MGGIPGIFGIGGIPGIFGIGGIPGIFGIGGIPGMPIILEGSKLPKPGNEGCEVAGGELAGSSDSASSPPQTSLA